MGTLSNKTVSIVAVKRNRVARTKMPDITARLRKVFGRKFISNKRMKAILVESRGNQ